jgi:WhiB family transcriptional regulator, redox-sensing transcriptional regulator
MKSASNVNASPACASLPVDTFFRADGEPTGQWALRQRVALAVCQACPLRDACLEQALRFPAVHQHGVAGGETAAARRRLLRDRRRAAASSTSVETEVAA